MSLNCINFAGLLIGLYNWSSRTTQESMRIIFPTSDPRSCVLVFQVYLIWSATKEILRMIFLTSDPRLWPIVNHPTCLSITTNYVQVLHGGRCCQKCTALLLEDAIFIFLPAPLQGKKLTWEVFISYLHIIDSNALTLFLRSSLRQWGPWSVVRGESRPL